MNDRLRDMLGREGVRFDVIQHREVYTAQERAAASQITGRRLAKVVVVHDGDGPQDRRQHWFALAVVPAAAYLDLHQLRTVTGRPRLTLAREDQFARLFPDCDAGAMPPFGGLYGLSVFLDSALAQEPEFVFEGGTHREEIRLPMREYLRLEKPVIASLAKTSSRAA
jgi:Ala-tRNA(Pro) deacylase